MTVWTPTAQVMAIVSLVYVFAAKDGKALIVPNLTRTQFDVYPTAPDTETSIYSSNNAFVTNDIPVLTVLKV